MRSLLVVLALLPGVLWAQTGRGFNSVEAYVASARIVYVGKIVSIESTTYEIPQDAPVRYGTPHRVVFAVSETIRGPKTKELELILALQPTKIYLQSLRQFGNEIMLVGGPNQIDHYPAPEAGLVEADKPAVGQWYQFRALDSQPTTRDMKGSTIQDQVYRYYDQNRMFTVDLGVVQGREAILRRARAFAKKYPEMLPTVYLGVPNPFGALVGSPNAYCMIRLPVCPEAENKILAVLKNPNVIFGRVKLKPSETERNVQISSAINALEPFKSKENEALLTKLADGLDPGISYRDLKYGSTDTVRYTATAILVKWKERG